VCLDRATVGGGLEYEGRLNLRSDVNGDCHGCPSKTYRTAPFVPGQGNGAS
jgi:hypothetical protein